MALARQKRTPRSGVMKRSRVVCGNPSVSEKPTFRTNRMNMARMTQRAHGLGSSAKASSMRLPPPMALGLEQPVLGDLAPRPPARGPFGVRRGRRVFLFGLFGRPDPLRGRQIHVAAEPAVV